MASSSSSSSSVILHNKYDVFLSFRGEDTRDNFTSHLYAALCRKQIQTFIDEDGLERGEYISPALCKAIEESKFSVIIFSQNYASSTWCLEELLKILECKEKVIPVFYKVRPSDLRKQKGSIGDAFLEHEKRFHQEPDKVKSWSAALTEASNIKGWDSDSPFNKPESKLVDGIVEDIWKKLMNNISPSSYCEGLVGIEKHVEHIKSLLLEFQVIGIWGMGGIGKTTIAEVVFRQISHQFEGCCFIANVREEVIRKGLLQLKVQLFSRILGEKNVIIDTLNTIPPSIMKRVQSKAFLVVLDDVDDLEQLEVLIGEFDKLCDDNRVIITTRDRNVVLSGYNRPEIYEVKGLNMEDGFQLFSNYAFKQNPQTEYLVELSNKIVDYVEGHPLALKVFGSSLYGKSEQVWKNALYKFSKGNKCSKGNLDRKIHDVLVISYKALEKEERDIFLDIACFFKEWDFDHVTQILDSCYECLHPHLIDLIDKSLICRTTDNVIKMHDLLQEMGWGIVHEESPKVLGNRSRLWNPDDTFKVLKNNTGTGAVQGLFLDLSKTSEDLYLNPCVFKNMPNLKFLSFYAQPFVDVGNLSSVHLPKGLKCLPDELRYLHWYKYPLTELPSQFSPENLLELALPYSKVNKLWRERKCLSKLIFLNLQDCNCLTEIPDLSDAVDLEVLNIRNCKSLVTIHPSNKYLSNLHILGSEDFPRFESLPSSICTLKTLKKLNLSGCLNLKIFEDLFSLSSLEVLDISEHNFEKIPEKFKQLSRLEEFYVNNCGKLQSIPDVPPSLKKLEARNCKHLQSLPRLLGSQGVDASELENASGRYSPNPDSSISAGFIFPNCFKLDENLKDYFLAEARVRFQNMATTSMRHRQVKEFDGIPAIKLLLPGNEVPNWITYRSWGYSLPIELSPYSNDKSFIGFTLCAAVKIRGDYCDVEVMCSFKSNYEPDDIYTRWVSRPGSMRFRCSHLFESDHVLLIYYPYFRDEISGGKFSTITFHFISNGNWEMKCCGAYPVYLDPKGDQPHVGICAIPNQYCDETPENVVPRGKDFGNIIRNDTNGCVNGTQNEEEIEMEQVNAPLTKNQVPPPYHTLCTRGGLLLTYCRTFLVYFLCGLGVLWLLERVGFSPLKEKFN